MDSTDVVDDVNALLKLGVGDSYRLEHIKQAYLQNKTIWITDRNYLQQMKEKYLTKLTSDTQSNIDENLENDPADGDVIHCWKCGKKASLGANFCMICGSSLFDVGAKPQTVSQQPPSNTMKNPSKTIGIKIPIIIGVPVLILILFGVGFSQGFFDDTLDRPISNSPTVNTPNTANSNDKGVSSVEPNSKCGAGTEFDPVTNSCMLATANSNDKGVSSVEPNSKCGAGTEFDPVTNSCILAK